MQEIIGLINEMTPYLLLGFFLAGLMHAFIPGMVYRRYLGGKGFRSVFYGALFGVPLPLCSCGVIPTAMSLRREGASKGATTSFLIATPETGVDSIFATYSLLGLPFAILRPIAAFCNALFGGWLINRFDHDSQEQQEQTGGTRCGCHEAAKPATFWGKMAEALKFGFVEMLADIGKWLIVGLLLAGLITILVPDDFFAAFRGNTQMSMLLVLGIAIPMYICATGSIPIAVALMLKGLTPGAALVLLMAGPACNMASILVINKVMGRRALVLYLLSIFTMAIFWGHVVDYLLPTEWFSQGILDASCCHEGGSSVLAWICTAVFALLIINAMFFHKHSHEHHSHEHQHDSCCTEDHTSKSCSNMKTYHIDGMNCNHCRTSAEKAILSVDNVTSASVDLSSKTAYVEGTATSEDVCKAVESLGFTCKPM